MVDVTKSLLNSNQLFCCLSKYIPKTVYLNQGNISFIYGQRKDFFGLKKVLLIQKYFPLM